MSPQHIFQKFISLILVILMAIYLMRYDLNLLPIFIALMEERSVTRAAERLECSRLRTAVLELERRHDEMHGAPRCRRSSAAASASVVLQPMLLALLLAVDAERPHAGQKLRDGTSGVTGRWSITVCWGQA